MKLQIIITIIILHALNLAFGQHEFEINGIVKNLHGDKIQFATIRVNNTTIGTISNSNGEFSLYIDSLQSIALEVNCLGYESNITNFSLEKLKDTITLSLIDSLYSLPKVTVFPQKYTKYTAGYAESDSKGFVKFKINGRKKSNLGSCIGKQIKVKNNAILNKVSFYLKENDFSQLKFRIKLLDKNLNLLFNENIIVTVDNQKVGWITTSITNKINLPKKFIVAIEWVESSNDGSVLTMPMKIPKFDSKHYYKFGAAANWKKYNYITSSIFVEYVVEDN